MSMVETEMTLSNVVTRVAEVLETPVADPREFCDLQMDRAIEDDDLTALVFWRAVAKALTP